ncbi:MAG: UvrB/UvrC motif-containing protein [Patescibacteria group bacterium]
MTLEQFKKKNIPNSPGVYLFTEGRKILYIGKATSLHDRVKSYFSKDLASVRSPLIVRMVSRAKGLRTIPTDSVLEALLLETRLIKTHQPAYNSKEKDDKSFNHIVITKEEFPRVLLVRQREAVRQGRQSYKKVFGPFPHGAALKDALKVIRKIFPFRDKCSPASISQQTLRVANVLRKSDKSSPPFIPKNSKEIVAGKPCFNAQIGLCPGVCTGAILKSDYAKNIRNIATFLDGNKNGLIRNLEREMNILARQERFEEAGKIKRTLFALRHIQDIALIKSEEVKRDGLSRIESYDIAHISGTSVVGVMVVLEKGVLQKSEYRKFKIQSKKGGDVGALKEILSRRLLHLEWDYPTLIVVDGGEAQLNAMRDVLSLSRLTIAVVSVVKDDRHKPREILGDTHYANSLKKEILLANAEAHRFAIAFHRRLRDASFAS